MRYKVLDTFRIGRNTSVTIQGAGNGLTNGMKVQDESGHFYHIESVAMVESNEPEKIVESTTILVSGNFDGNELYC